MRHIADLSRRYRLSIVIVGTSVVVAGIASSLRLDRLTWEIRDELAATVQVARIVGVPEHLARTLSAELFVVEEDNTPFLHDQIVGRSLWRVNISDWKLELPSAAAGTEDLFARVFEVLLDPVTGNVLKISSRWPEGVPSIPPEPPAHSTEFQMSTAGAEKYHSFPAEAPSISFLEALDVVHTQGRGNPLNANQIIGLYVVQSIMGNDPRPVWVVTLRGIPPLRTSIPGVPVDALNHTRNIVDAETGRWFSASSIPQPLVGSASALMLTPAPDQSTVTFDITSSMTGQQVSPLTLIDWSIRATVSVEDNFGLALVIVDLVQDELNPELIGIPPGLRPADMQGFDRPDRITNPAPMGTGSAYGGTPFGDPGPATDLLQIGGAQNALGVPGDGIGLDVDVDEGVGQEPGGRVIATGSFLAPCTAGQYFFSIEWAVANVLEQVNTPQASVVKSAETVINNGNFWFTVDTAAGQGPPDHRWYVNASAVGMNDGSNWANAFRNLQDAIALAGDDPFLSDEIWVAAGTSSCPKTHPFANSLAL